MQLDGRGGAIIEPQSRRATNNNVAQYEAPLMGLEMLAAMGNKEILVQGDRVLPARQLNATYRVGGAKPLPFFERGCGLLRPFDGCIILHLRRDAYKLADQLAHLGIDAALKRITRAKVD